MAGCAGPSSVNELSGGPHSSSRIAEPHTGFAGDGQVRLQVNATSRASTGAWRPSHDTSPAVSRTRPSTPAPSLHPRTHAHLTAKRRPSRSRPSSDKNFCGPHSPATADRAAAPRQGSDLQHRRDLESSLQHRDMQDVRPWLAAPTWPTVVTHDNGLRDHDGAVVVVQADDVVARMAATLDQHRISAVPVIDRDGDVVALVSEYDLLVKPGGPTAFDVMTTAVVSGTEYTDVEDVRHLRIGRRIHRVPVRVWRQAIGIVSRADIVAMLITQWVCPACGESMCQCRHAHSSRLGGCQRRTTDNRAIGAHYAGQRHAQDVDRSSDSVRDCGRRRPIGAGGGRRPVPNAWRRRARRDPGRVQPRSANTPASVLIHAGKGGVVSCHFC